MTEGVRQSYLGCQQDPSTYGQSVQADEIIQETKASKRSRVFSHDLESKKGPSLELMRLFNRKGNGDENDSIGSISM